MWERLHVFLRSPLHVGRTESSGSLSSGDHGLYRSFTRLPPVHAVCRRHSPNEVAETRMVRKSERYTSAHRATVHEREIPLQSNLGFHIRAITSLSILHWRFSIRPATQSAANLIASDRVAATTLCVLTRSLSKFGKKIFFSDEINRKLSPCF